MRKLLACCVLAVTLMSAGYASSAAPSSDRQHLRMDAGWRFYRGALSGLTGGRVITHWRWKAASDSAAGEAAPGADTSRDGWQDAKPGQDTFGGRHGYAWYETTLPTEAGAHHTLHFESVDDNASRA